jgi:thiamine-monophosphate kinase
MPDRPQRVSDLGEFGLIDRIAERVGPARRGVVLGLGDDVAALRPESERLTLVSCDVQVEGTHFEKRGCDAERLGRKAVAINFSDIAAAGGHPAHLLVSLVLPSTTPLRFVDDLYVGIVGEAARFGAGIVGGNVSAGEQIVIDVTVIGVVAPADLLRRSGARPGDRLMVTGSLGAAAAGLRLAAISGPPPGRAVRQRVLDALETPVPRIEEVAAMLAAGGVTAAIDLSDGLAADLGHLCRESGVGARLDADALPVDAAAAEIGRLVGVDPLELALHGGEDYEILFSADPDAVAPIRAAVEHATGTAVTEIGGVVSNDSGLLLVGSGEERVLDASGWRHF